MSKSQELKIFCDKFSLIFPKFNILQQQHDNVIFFICNISWYDDNIITCEANNKEMSIINAISQLSIWLEFEENFIYLITLHEQSMKY